MDSYILNKKYTLKLLSPLHIGSGERIPSYMIFCNKGQCFIFDEMKLAAALAEKGGQFIDYFIHFANQERPNLAQFLRKIFGNTKELTNFVERAKAYSAKAKAYPSRDLHPFMRDSLNRLYIPGTSIKGAIRTAVMYNMLKKMDDTHRQRILVDNVKMKLDRIKEDLYQKGRVNFQYEAKWFDQEIENKLMDEYYLNETMFKFDSHTDIMRAIKVSDSDCLEPDSAVIEEIKVYNKGYDTGIKIYVETLPPGTEVGFNISIDWHLLRRFQLYSKERCGLSMDEIIDIVANPLKAVENWSHDLLEYERRFSKNSLSYYFPEPPNINLGFGGGLLTKTVDLLLPENLRVEILKLFKRRGTYLPAPSSRRFTSEGRPLGWAKIEEETSL